MMKSERVILIDADVVSHFITGGAIIYLPKIFPNNKIRVLEQVYKELERFPKKKVEINNLLQFQIIEHMKFPDDEQIRKEYTHLKKLLFLGDGEAACLAVVNHSKDILASSNLKDTKRYCELHNIDYLTTMDFLCEALRTGLFNEESCDEFTAKVKKAGSKLPVNCMKDFKCRSLDFISKS